MVLQVRNRVASLPGRPEALTWALIGAVLALGVLTILTTQRLAQVSALPVTGPTTNGVQTAAAGVHLDR